MADTEKVLEGFFELMSAHRGEVIITVTSAAVSIASERQFLSGWWRRKGCSEALIFASRASADVASFPAAL